MTEITTTASVYPSQQRCPQHGPGTDVYYEGRECPWCAERQRQAMLHEEMILKLMDQFLEFTKRMKRLADGDENLP